MDLIQKTFRQFFDLYRDMGAGQRLALISVPLAMAIGFGFLLFSQSKPQMAALSWGKVFSTEEVIAAEQALIQAGLTEFRREGQRIMVPVTEVDRYNAALLEFDAIPSDLGSQMMKQLENLGPFTTDKQRIEMREAMLLQEIRRTLKAIPDLEDARVVIANSNRRSSWNQKSRVTASVAVRPKSGRDVSSRLVGSIRAAVASMVPDLQPSDVTVLDTVHGISHTGEAPDDPFDSKLVQRVREVTREYEQKIQRGLNYITDVGVNVHVDVDNLKSSVVRTQNIDKAKIAPIVTQESKSADKSIQPQPRGEAGQVANRPQSVNAQPDLNKRSDVSQEETRTINGVSFEITEKQLIAAMPTAVQVSVSIPRDYYRQVADNRTTQGEKDASRLDLGSIEKEVISNVQKSVLKLIPSGSKPEAVSVVSVDRLPQTIQEFKVPFTETAFQFLRQYGGSLLMAAFVLWSLMTLRRLTPAAPPAVASSDVARQATAKLSPEARLAEAVQGAIDVMEKPKEITKRDLLQNVVRDNPEQSAVVIGKWIESAVM